MEKTVEKIIKKIKEKPKITLKELEKETGLTRRGVEWNIDICIMTSYVGRII